MDGRACSSEAAIEDNGVKFDSEGIPFEAIAPANFCRRSERKYISASSAARGAITSISAELIAMRENQDSPSSPDMGGAGLSFSPSL